MIRVSQPGDQVSRLGAVKLVLGTPVESFIETPPRTGLSFLSNRCATRSKRRSASAEDYLLVAV